MTKLEAIQCFQRELQVNRYARTTVDNYTSCLISFLNHYRQFNGYKTGNDIKDFLITVNARSYHKQMTATLRLFYALVVKKEIDLSDIPYPRPSHYLPQILSVQEVDRIMRCVTNLKHRAILQIMYSCALRVSEPTRIDVSHIDFDRETLFVKDGKGSKDRIVPVPGETLDLMFTYINTYRPKRRLFEGQGGDYTTRSIQQMFHKAVRQAGIYKTVSSHSLRHSRATHLCDAGVDIYKLKDFLGHNNIKTTELYLHLSKLSLVNHIAAADRLIAQSLLLQLEAA